MNHTGAKEHRQYGKCDEKELEQRPRLLVILQEEPKSLTPITLFRLRILFSKKTSLAISQSWFSVVVWLVVTCGLLGNANSGVLVASMNLSFGGFVVALFSLRLNSVKNWERTWAMLFRKSATEIEFRN
jgi:hypothetical protein